jgi:hypothetical protein
VLLNNWASVELLSSSPDFEAAADALSRAFKTVRDDYSELVILNNLAISQWHCGRHNVALDNVAQMLASIKEPTFGDRDIVWAVAYNASMLLASAGKELEALSARAQPLAFNVPPQTYPDYWRYRYDEAAELPDRFRHMARHSYHPLFLSDRPGGPHALEQRTALITSA